MKDKNESKKHRHFGLLVGGIFIVIGVWPAIFRGQNLRLWALLAGGVLVIPGLLMPGFLAPFYRVWMAVGRALGWVNTRLILGLTYYIVFAPVGLVMRLLGRDPMQRGREPEAETYRVSRHPRPPSHMRHQF